MGVAIYPNFEEILKQIVKEISAYQPEKIILYGSAARGEITEESDMLNSTCKCNIRVKDL